MKSSHTSQKHNNGISSLNIHNEIKFLEACDIKSELCSSPIENETEMTSFFMDAEKISQFSSSNKNITSSLTMPTAALKILELERKCEYYQTLIKSLKTHKTKSNKRIANLKCVIVEMKRKQKLNLTRNLTSNPTCDEIMHLVTTNEAKTALKTIKKYLFVRDDTTIQVENAVDKIKNHLDKIS